MFVDFLYELRERGLKVGPQEALALSQALTRGLHETTLDGFYRVARALCVHREEDLDAFDRAFAHYFRGVPDDAVQIAEEVLDWLAAPPSIGELTPEERELLETLDLEDVRRQLRERLAEQTGRHDRGNKWVGTGGTSPYGRGGQHPSGVRIGEGTTGGRGAMALSERRRFRELRSDVTLDTRQIEVALRRLRAYVREGAQDELDLPGTIDATARSAGELEIKMRAPRRSNLRVLLLLDVGGSMDPHSDVCERLFSAAKRATHFKELRTLYFHNCVYGRVYDSATLLRGPRILELLRECDPSWKLIIVGDALMAPWELTAISSPWSWTDEDRASGLAWLVALTGHFERAVWLNPEPEAAWYGTAEVIRKVFPMYRLTLDGLTAAIQHLLRGGLA